MALLKNKGPMLTSEYYGSVDLIPPEFRAKVGLRRFAQEVPVDILPDLLMLPLIQSQVVQERTDERLKTNFEFIGDLDTELDSETFIERTGQVGHRTVTLVPEGTELTVDTLTESADQRNLGNGLVEQNQVQVDELFDEHVYAREKPDIAPEWAKALLPIFEESFLDSTLATDPDPLASGVLFERQQQTTEFHRRLTRRSRDLIALPVQRVGYRTNRYKQVETVTEILELDSTVPAVPTALMDVTFEVLGDGSAVEQHVEIPEVFEGLSSSTEIPDLLPDIFKALLATHVREHTEEGIVIDPPVLDVGDFEKVESQIDEFDKRIRTRGRAGITLPQSVTVSRKTTEEYGGEITKLEGFLDDSEPAVEEGLEVVNSEVRNLGNGTWFRQTEKLNTATEWPELVGTEVDPRTGIIVGVAKKVVDAGTLGGTTPTTYTDVKSLDKWRSIQIVSTLNVDSLPAPVTWETTMEHRFPSTLLGLAWVWAAATAPFAYDFDMALVLDMIEGYAGPCRAKVTESFSVGAPTDVVTPTTFCPQAHLVGFAWAFAADPSEACGTCVGIARSQARTWSIPPSLHADLDIGGAVTLSGGTFTSILPATSPSALPAPGSLITKACDVERWRFNVFYRRLIEIFVPACATEAGTGGATVLLADGSSADAYITKDFGVDHDDVWITFDLAFTDEALFWWDTSGSGNFIIALSSGDQNIASVYEIKLNELGGGSSWYLKGGGSHNQTVGPPPPTANVWQTCEMHIHKTTASTTVHFYVNGSFTNAFSDPETFGVRKVRFGLHNAAVHNTDTKAYFGNVKVGTTRGASDLISDDFSGGLGAWTVTGSCSTVSNPF